MIMTDPKTIVHFELKDLERVECVKNLLLELVNQIDDLHEDGFDFDFSEDEFTRKTLALLDDIKDLWEQF